jgi:hypothetical protein
MCVCDGACDCAGIAISFFTPDNFKCAADLTRVLREAQQTIPPTLEMYAQRGGAFGGGGGGGEWCCVYTCVC